MWRWNRVWIDIHEICHHWQEMKEQMRRKADRQQVKEKRKGVSIEHPFTKWHGNMNSRWQWKEESPPQGKESQIKSEWMERKCDKGMTAYLNGENWWIKETENEGNQGSRFKENKESIRREGLLVKDEAFRHPRSVGFLSKEFISKQSGEMWSVRCGRCKGSQIQMGSIRIIFINSLQ